ncbi:MAG: tRNA (adenosine(37)-N6)-threonylcarbamoyltransferase complex ATPase subunit type 1 TsaE [Gammaproteobacteria bacterium]|nr:tRNA (adenosine(37)-N6)-threonylcarbamoyltransferase complex ATPase subunit type 1 TsaE [Gammaproteobacteria bacterium]MCH9743898.1 tRNA (adenosine(37)-N6)-threonylcarbamoyltransferase complex ATPase subunit type 1 TsaE [Gammaproteobacteria bacterium]
MKHSLKINSEAEMLAFGAAVANAIKEHQSQGLKFYLQGQLGAGKTTWARGFLQALGHTGRVKSPTYSLVEPYQIQGFDVYHIDLYRLKNPREVESLGLSDYLTANAICLIEWPEKALQYLPEASLYCTIDLLLGDTGNSRECHLEARDAIGETLLQSLKALGK